MKRNARAIAFYLPQFHPIPENDQWWEKGFTEWTNVTKARPLFFGHHQPHLPADLGFYDLRIPEVRKEQAEMATRYGVEGFAYWHYWFSGRRILERPLQEVLAARQPHFPFCLAWANATWSGIWHGCPDKILLEQKYDGIEDYKAHFYAILDALKDDRYIQVNGKKLFLFYKPFAFKDVKLFIDCWRELARTEGLGGFYFVGIHDYSNWYKIDTLFEQGFDGVTGNPPNGNLNYTETFTARVIRNVLRRMGIPNVVPYGKYARSANPKEMRHPKHFPCVVPNWDNTPRSKAHGLVLQGSTPSAYGRVLEEAVGLVADKPFEERLVFIKSWNEWAEGNYLEPDREWGHAYLKETAKHLLQPGDRA